MNALTWEKRKNTIDVNEFIRWRAVCLLSGTTFSFLHFMHHHQHQHRHLHRVSRQYQRIIDHCYSSHMLNTLCKLFFLFKWVRRLKIQKTWEEEEEKKKMICFISYRYKTETRKRRETEKGCNKVTCFTQEATFTYEMMRSRRKHLLAEITVDSLNLMRYTFITSN